MVLKLAFKTAFPYGFSAFFIDTRLVNRVDTASLGTFLLRQNTQLAFINAIERISSVSWRIDVL